VKPGIKVLVIPSDHRRVYQGEINFLSPFLDEETHLATAHVSLESGQPGLYIGQFVEGSIVIEEKEVSLLVVKSSLGGREGHREIFIRNGGKIERRKVGTGREDLQNVEILSGIKREDQYFFNYKEGLSDFKEMSGPESHSSHEDESHSH
jgi:hypothetical protein